MPAVVGSWPEPFRSGYDGKRRPTELTCMSGRDDACAETEKALRDAGADLSVAKGTVPRADPGSELRVLVGSWADVRSDRTARELEQGPGTSGVYAKPRECDGGWGLELLGADGGTEGEAAVAGWVAATQRGDEQPTWVVSGTDAAEAADAAALLGGDGLRDHYAVATAAGAATPLPAQGPVAGASAGSCGGNG